MGWSTAKTAGARAFLATISRVVAVINPMSGAGLGWAGGGGAAPHSSAPSSNVAGWPAPIARHRTHGSRSRAGRRRRGARARPRHRVGRRRHRQRGGVGADRVEHGAGSRPGRIGQRPRRVARRPARSRGGARATCSRRRRARSTSGISPDARSSTSPASASTRISPACSTCGRAGAAASGRTS